MVHVAVNNFFIYITLKKINIFLVRFWGWGHQKAYAVYAFINVDNCERPLNCTTFINVSHVNNESWLLIIAKKKILCRPIQYLHEVHFNLSVIARSCSVILACPLNGHSLFGKPFIR